MKTLNLGIELKELHHEFHTPLTGILGMAHLLKDQVLNAEQQEMVEAILTSGERLLDFIDNRVLVSPIIEK